MNDLMDRIEKAKDIVNSLEYNVGLNLGLNYTIFNTDYEEYKLVKDKIYILYVDGGDGLEKIKSFTTAVNLFCYLIKYVL